MGWVKEKKSNSKARPSTYTGHSVSGQAPHLAAGPEEAAKGGILIDVIIISLPVYRHWRVYTRG